ncbi:putative aminophospholipid-translocase [Podospora pseudoanserina]|uniref:Phospholipid-transporting ATPase n=1 Tax=Podospora pseudoanserina TaxID=2609844 RepID=A0ABR0IIV3_9PEZI|nr:putative aminophospholipid-translocase [Podospora pseudoanserina]
MPPPSQYHPSAPPDSPDDSDSELDLDIEELDPTPASGSSQASQQPKQTERRAPRIALRTLRMGGLRRGANRNGYGELGRSRAAGEEDAEALLRDDDGNNPRYSDASTGGRDDAPLLSEHGGGSGPRRRRRSFAADTLRVGRLRLPSFMSGTDADHGKDNQEEEEKEEDDPSSSRLVAVGSRQVIRFPPNSISNAKYTAWSFLPVTLYNEFSFFFNMYFLLVALSQIIPALRIGYLSTYIAPLAFVLVITLGKEAYDDLERRRRDNEANSELYTVLQFDEPGVGSANLRSRKTLKSSHVRKGSKRAIPQGDRLSDIREEEEQMEADGSHRFASSHVHEISKKSKDLKVGDVLKLSKGHRVPADVIVLKCLSNEAAAHQGEPETLLPKEESLLVDHLVDPGQGSSKDVESAAGGAAEGSSNGETFIRTDQLDGETDWKLRLASPLSQNLPIEELVRLRVTAGKPDRKVNEFTGTLELLPTRQDAVSTNAFASSDEQAKAAPLSIDNTAWANTVIASHATTLAVVIYSGPQTRSALSTSPSRSKTGLLEYEINSLTKILCFLTLALSIILVAAEGFGNTKTDVWYIKIMKFLVLFSTIVPISLRVNLDMGKSVYSWFIQRDPGIPGAVVRTSTIPEDLGRIEYLLSDKTGTLTQNDMEMKKIHVGTVSYANDAMDEVAGYVRQGFTLGATNLSQVSNPPLATPSSSSAAGVGAGATRQRREIGSRVRDVVMALALCHNVTPTTEEDERTGRMVNSYQASSPDEIAIVKWTESVGLRLAYRDRRSIVLESTETGRVVVKVRILDIFPFTSEGKRMGIVVRFAERLNETGDGDGEIWFYQKGADTVMTGIVAANDWLDEETANMAREGLRTLVVGRKRLSNAEYREFEQEYKRAALAISGREAGVQGVVGRYLEHDLELLGVTGVEDKLQRDVKPSLELLRNAGIKIWMLTGDKVETARCVGVSSKLVARGQYIHTVEKLRRKDSAQEHIDFLRSKPDSCLLIDGESLGLFLTHYRTEFISVAVKLPTVVACRCSPTQKAEVARLIKEYTKKRVCCIGDGGNDVSMIQAADVGVGIVGKEGRQASLAADFSIEQFCHLTKLLVWHGRNSYKRSAKLAQFVIHRGLIIAVCQTMFSIAVDFEPLGLYKDWLMVGYATIYTAAPVLSLVLDKDVDEELANLYPELYKELTEGRSLSYRTFFVWVFVSIYQGCLIQGLSQVLTEVDSPRMVAVSYTVLVLNELLMVAVEITTWHWVMVVSIVGTFLVFVGSVPFLGGYFDLGFLMEVGFYWRVAAILAMSLIPTWAAKVIQRTMKPPSYRKVQGI